MLIFFLKILTQECFNFDNDYNCNDNQFEYPEEWDERCFQTPPRNDIFGNYKPSYQDMHYFVGYVQLKYSEHRDSCTINFITKINPKLGIEGQDYKIIYKFGEIEQENNIFVVNSYNSFPNGIPISAKIIDDKNNELVKLSLENEYFLWDNPIINQDEKYENGQKGVIVELFGWPFNDIAEECEFIGYSGYMGVKIWPPNESILTYESIDNGELNSWLYLYEPVSYKLESRMGDKNQLKNMIKRCRENGVRIYSELVINQMSGNGNDMYTNHKNNDCSTWGPKSGSSGSPFWTTRGLYKNNIYTGLKPVLEYPAVPYFASDFHCYREVNNKRNGNDLNYGWIFPKLADLNTEKEYVQQRIADFLTELISIGISGFSFNAAKHISPDNFVEIFKKFKNNLGGGEFPEDFLAYLQFDMQQDEITLFFCRNNYDFGRGFVDKLKTEQFNDNDINKIKLWNSGYIYDRFLQCDGEWVISENRHILSLYIQEIQKTSSNDIYIIQKNLNEHKNLNIQMLKDVRRNWKIKMLFSSCSLTNNGGIGFPDGKSDCKKCKNEQCKNECTKSVPFQKAYNPLSLGYDSGNETNWKEGTYTRVHRNIDIINAMREWMGFENFTENELYEKERFKADCNESCLICNEESKILNKCIYCNIEKGYYPIFYGNIYERYHECIHNDSNIERLYLDLEDNYFKPCYESCRTCNKEGNKINHNCLTCDINYIFMPEDLDSNNCVLNCTNPYYFNSFGQYKCSDTSKCPKEAKFLIKEKNKCINDCQNDNIYKYEYNGNCLRDCPENTLKEQFLCKDLIMETDNFINSEKVAIIPTHLSPFNNKNNNEKCILSEEEIESKKISKNILDSLVKEYSDNYKYEENHISQFKNDDYRIIIYKNSNCINELNLSFPIIDFGNCYSKAQNFYSINDSLIIVTMEKYNNNNPITTNSFFDPKTNSKLEAETICKEIPIIIEECLSSFINKKENYDLMVYLTNQGINIFDLKDSFYTNICFDFDFPINRDITLKDRLLTFYPNITVCDPGCERIGINLTTMKAICRCQFIDILNSEFFKDNFIASNFVDEVYEFISETNIEVIKCYKYMFKYFFKLFGGYIVIVLIIFQIILSIFYFKFHLLNVKRYINRITQDYLDYLLEKDKDKHKRKEKIEKDEKEDKKREKNDKSKKKEKNEKEDKGNEKKRKKDKDKKEKNEKDIKKENKENKEKKIKVDKEKTDKKDGKDKDGIRITFLNERLNHNKKKSNYFPSLKNMQKSSGRLMTKDSSVLAINKTNFCYKDYIRNSTKNIPINKSKITENFKEKTKGNNINFDEYLETSIDDMDYDDAIKKEKRKFFSYLFESIRERQIIISTFILKDPLKPRSIKIMLFNLNILLYFVINGLFFNEEYVSKVYNLKTEEKFFSFLPRSINRLAYTTLASLAINFIVECFKIDEKKLRGIFIREKKDIINLKKEVSLLVKLVIKRYFAFIIVCFFLLLVSFYYLLCFNYVYPHAQIEWVKSSIIVIIIFQIISILSSFLETSLRYMSFLCKSEKLYKLSKLLD